MIRVYLDWNVVSSFKQVEFKEVKSFIDKYKRYLLFPYTPAHFTDLMKSYSPSNQFFKQDLETLEFLASKHLLRWGNSGIEPLFITPSEYFKDQRDKEDVSELMDMEKVLKYLDESLCELGLGEMSGLMKSLLQLHPSR